jgi:hypothetical protein
MGSATRKLIATGLAPIMPGRDLADDLRLKTAASDWRQQFAVVAPKPPSPGASDEFPTVLGISPAIGPPFAASAGVESV